MKCLTHGFVAKKLFSTACGLVVASFGFMRALPVLEQASLLQLQEMILDLDNLAQEATLLLERD